MWRLWGEEELWDVGAGGNKSWSVNKYINKGKRKKISKKEIMGLFLKYQVGVQI